MPHVDLLTAGKNGTGFVLWESTTANAHMSKPLTLIQTQAGEQRGDWEEEFSLRGRRVDLRTLLPNGQVQIPYSSHYYVCQDQNSYMNNDQSWIYFGQDHLIQPINRSRSVAKIMATNFKGIALEFSRDCRKSGAFKFLKGFAPEIDKIDKVHRILQWFSHRYISCLSRQQSWI